MKNSKKGVAPAFMIWMTLTLALGMMGAGMAAWQVGIVVGGVISTGDIDPIFKSVKAPEAGSVYISEGKKAITISIENAVPGEAYVFTYTIENRGSVPIKLALEDNQYDPKEILLKNEFTRDSIGGNGSIADGTLTISLGHNASFETKYEFSMKLLFQQWNAAPL